MNYCPACREVNADSASSCISCGTRILGSTASSPPGRPTATTSSPPSYEALNQPRYPALELYLRIYVIAGWVIVASVAVVSFFGLKAAFAALDPLPLLASTLGLAGGMLLVALSIFAAAQMARVFIDSERHLAELVGHARLMTEKNTGRT